MSETLNNKKSLLIAITLLITLLSTTAVYAFTVSGYSKIVTGTITMTGHSVTKTSAVCEIVDAQSTFYRNGTLVTTGFDRRANTNYAQANVGTTNLPGNQYWDIHGAHWAKSGDVSDISTSYTSVQY